MGSLPWLCNETAKIWHILPCPLCSMYSSGWILSYLALMLTSMRGCVTLWPWPISSRLFSCDIAYFVDYIHVSKIQPVEGQLCVTFHFSVKGQGHTGCSIFFSLGWGYPSRNQWSTISSFCWMKDFFRPSSSSSIRWPSFLFQVNGPAIPNIWPIGC